MNPHSESDIRSLINTVESGEAAQNQFERAARRVHRILHAFIDEHNADMHTIWNHDKAMGTDDSLWDLESDFYEASIASATHFRLVTSYTCRCETNTQHAHLPLEWLWLSDADLNAAIDTLFQCKLATIRAHEKRREDEEEARERAEFERLKERFAP